MRAEQQEQLNLILQEMPDWQRTMDLPGNKEITVFIDLKSPHAYLAVRPSIELAKDFSVHVNFLPYTLSYTDIGVSSSVEADMQRRPPDAAADRKARMYYAAARQYAALQNLPLRSPIRLLDSTLAHKVFLFAKQQRQEVPFMMLVYLTGWGSGWRDYELESLDQLRNTLAETGVDTQGLDAFVAPGGPGEAQLLACNQQAEASGCVGVPHYVMHDAQQSRELGLFGREHLALLRSKLADEGLARRADVKPEFSHAWRGPQA
ncbi:MAG: DsbA family protein [Pseudomonadota bacterium]